MDDTVVLVTVVGNKSLKPARIFPLTVDYIEKTYAAGKIPGGFFKREGRPSEGDADLAPHRPPAAPAVPGRLLQRSAGGGDGRLAESGDRPRTFRR